MFWEQSCVKSRFDRSSLKARNGGQVKERDGLIFFYFLK
jgi:hypothetical protein